MKIGGSKKKKAVSAVVATILIVMITVVAIGIIWVTILPMIRENLAVSDVCENAGISIISSQGYTCYKPSNITMVQVSKGNSDIAVTGLKFSISSSGNSYDYNEQKVAYSNSDYNVYYLNTSEFEKIEKISVVPTVKFGDSEKSCSSIFLEDIPLCSSNVNLVEVSAGKLIGRSYLTNAPEAQGCVANNSCRANTCPNLNCTDICGNNYTGTKEPNCSCASSTLIGQNCSDGCEGICFGTKRDGSILAPFAIYNWTDLNNTRNNLTASYILMNDLGASDIDYEGIAGLTANGGAGWEPIGKPSYCVDPICSFGSPSLAEVLCENTGCGGTWTEQGCDIGGEIDPKCTNSSSCEADWGCGSTYIHAEFIGTFNGNGFEINNLYINLPSTTSVGLFGYCKNGSSISNVGLINSVVIGKTNVGGLVGLGSSGTISNSYVKGTVSGISYTGGLIGRFLTGKISNSSSEGFVNGSMATGGLVGSGVDSEIIDSYSKSNVLANYNMAAGGTGGLAGSIYRSKVTNSYATGSINGTANLHVSGFVGYVTDSSSISNSYATGSVNSSNHYSGGLVAFLDTGCNITNSYTLGNVGSAGNYKGGLVGYSRYATITNSYATGNISSVGENIGGLIGYKEYGTLESSFSTGKVQGTQKVSGLIGRTAGGIIANCYWDDILSGQSFCFSVANDPKCLATHNNPSWYFSLSNAPLSSWTWGENGNWTETGSYPKLSWQN
jgi:FlaG/FlaF family flagellin (archaellin)